MSLPENYKSNKPVKRTLSQNDAIHLLCGWIAEALNREGITPQRLLKDLKDFGYEGLWTTKLVKEVWRIIQIDELGKKSTTELNSTSDIEKIYEPLNKFLSEHYGIGFDFPSEDTLIKRSENNQD